jgi:hypothetical protein
MACDDDADAPRTMVDCLNERLDILRSAIPDVQAWYDDGADLGALDMPPVAVHQAWAYLEGAADMADVTVSELLDEHEISFNSSTPYRRVAATIRFRNVGATGRKPIMRPFYECDDGTGWAVIPDVENRYRDGQRVVCEIRSEDDQFAYPVSR